MRLSEMRTEVTPQKINKVMESRFGFSIDYDNLTYAKAQRLRNALGENIMAIKKSFGAHTAEKNAKYMELMLVKEGLDKWLGSEQGLFESEMGRSEAVLAAKDIVDSVQDMLEKISKIQNEQVPALIDTIRDQIGSEQAEQFKGSISPMLVELYSALSTAREGSDTAVRQLAGEDVGQSMDMDLGGGDADLGGASDFDDDDMFGAEPAAAGGDIGDLDQPELGRERRDVSEHFALPTSKGKDRGPRDTGRGDELARRAELGKHPITRHAPDYKEKGKYGSAYDIAGPKGKLPEGEVDEMFTFPDTAKKGGRGNPSQDKLGHRGGMSSPMGDPRGYKDMVKGTGAFGQQAKRIYGINGPKGVLPEEGGVPTTPKQKRFAALADPKDKITYADKIAGAKKN